jgi:hypothetical protein
MERTNEQSEMRARLHERFDEDTCFALARSLVGAAQSRPEARELLFQLLTRNPSHKRARVLLSRAFYLDGLTPFALQQLQTLRGEWESPELSRLIGALGGRESPALPSALPEESSYVPQNLHAEAQTDVVAEVDIDFDFLEDKA